MVLVIVHGWAGKTKENKIEKCPFTSSLASFNINVTCCDFCWAREGTVLWISAHLTSPDSLGMLYNKINTLVRPFPPSFQPRHKMSYLKFKCQESPL
jgi:hypothetical protein